jgi:hypothetical protein
MTVSVRELPLTALGRVSLTSSCSHGVKTRHTHERFLLIANTESCHLLKTSSSRLQILRPLTQSVQRSFTNKYWILRVRRTVYILATSADHAPSINL